jgi:hypothetical protein
MAENTDFSMFGIKAVDKGTMPTPEGTWFFNVNRAIDNINRDEIEDYDADVVFLKIPNILEYIYVFDIFNWKMPSFTAVHMDITSIDPHELAFRKKSVNIQSADGFCEHLSITDNLMDDLCDAPPANGLPVTRISLLQSCLPILRGDALSIEYVVDPSDMEKMTHLRKSFVVVCEQLSQFAFAHKLKRSDFTCKLVILQENMGVSEIFWPLFPGEWTITNESKKNLSPEDQQEALKKGNKVVSERSSYDCTLRFEMFYDRFERIVTLTIR